MASQNDLSFITQRAWVRVVVKVSGPIKIIGGELSGFFRLEFTNSGALPANVDRTCNAAYPWNMNPATSDEPRVSYIINSYKSTPLTRRSVIFPQQTVEEALQASIWLPGKEITNNMAMGFVLVLRGAIRYDYPGNTQVHYTTFHVHVMRALDPAAVSPLHTIPTDDGVVIPASEIFIANQAGETEAT